MATHCYDEGNSLTQAYLVDGYLPTRSSLARTAGEIAAKIDALPKEERNALLEKPFAWAHWDEDSFFEYIAYNTRSLFHRHLPKECKGYIWSEAWLLKPKRWEDAFGLTDQRTDQSRRRLLVTLYQGCKHGDKCLAHLVKTSGMQVVPDAEYRNLQVFKDSAEDLLEDITLPFKAPCIVAGEKIEQHGYEFRSFGN